MTKAEQMKGKTQKIPINRVIIEGLNVRIDVGDISELQRDIAERGLLQAITVRPVNGNYELVTGRRRYESCKGLGWTKISAVIRTYENDQQARDDSWAENVHRKNMTEEEKAKYVKDTEEWIREENPDWEGHETKIRKALREHVDMSSKQIKTIYEMGELQPEIDSVVIAGPEVRLTEEKPKISINRAKKLNEKWNDPHVQETLSELSPEERRSLRNTLAVEVATRRGGYEILKKFTESPLRPVNEIVAETLREAITEKGKSATTHFPGELVVAIEKYQKDKELGKWSDAIKSLVRIGLTSEGYTINAVTQEAIVE